MKTEEKHLTPEKLRESQTYCQKFYDMVLSLVIVPLPLAMFFVFVVNKSSISDKNQISSILMMGLFVFVPVHFTISLIKISRHPEDYCVYPAKIINAQLKKSGRVSYVICTFAFEDSKGSILKHEYNFSASRFSSISLNLIDHEMQIAYDAKRGRFNVIGDLPY